MRKIFIAVTTALLSVASVAGAQRTEVMATVNQFTNDFNKGDIKAAVAMCADQTSIIDELAPYAWRGADACTNWANDYDADATKNGITDGFVTLGTPRHVTVTGDNAYVVLPATYRFKQKGKLIRETGAVLTVALQKGDSGWRIAAWSWAKP